MQIGGLADDLGGSLTAHAAAAEVGNRNASGSCDCTPPDVGGRPISTQAAKVVADGRL